MKQHFNLKHNKTGSVYEIETSQCKFLARISDESDNSHLRHLLAGIVKGAIINLGVEPPVRVDVKAHREHESLYATVKIEINFAPK